MIARTKENQYRIQPLKHQLKALDWCDGREYYALLMEQGTGKTATLIMDAARRYPNILGVVVFAPNGVHSNWVLRELPKHMPSWLPYKAAAYYSSPRAEERKELDALFSQEPFEGLRFLAVNWDALNTEEGIATIKKFIAMFPGKVMGVADESQRIKNPAAKRTKGIEKLKEKFSVRVIMSGTAILNSPWDAFSQFGFLSPSILKIQSYIAFKNEYAEMLGEGHGLMRHIVMRKMPELIKRYGKEFNKKALLDLHGGDVELAREAYNNLIIKRHIESGYGPQLIARDKQGNPKWKNLDKLEALIAPHSFRVLKKDCLDLPEKVYEQIYFRMTPKQAQAYELLRDELRLQLEDGRIAPMQRIGAMTKLSQIVSGYFLIPGTDQAQRIMPTEENPKIKALLEMIEDLEGQFIIWARFRHEIADICAALKLAKIEHVQYHGGVKRAERPEAIDAFERGDKRAFVGQQAAGGTGITLIAPSSSAEKISVIYYSNTFSLEDRLQSEDRAHRIGQEKSVVYTDILCVKTIDERIVDALRSKTNLAQAVLGDKTRAMAVLG